MKINSKKILAAVASAGIGYTLGSINPAYTIGLRNGYDIREKGSGNPGASNTMILEGKAAGAFVMAFDVSKAAVAVSTSRRLFPESESAGEIAGAAAILGHMFPASMGFKGGKGLACIGGTVLAFGMQDFSFMLFTELSILLATKYLCFVPMSASVIYPLYRGITTGNWKGAAILGSVVPPIFVKHIENLKRISEGKEFKASFLWKKQEELERTGWISEIE